MLVEIKPIEGKIWHGKTGKDSFSQPKVVEVLYDTKTGGYATGLTEEEATKYGKLLGVNLDDKFNLNEAHPYWSSKAAELKLPNHTLVLDTDKPSDFVKWKNAKASKKIANSMKEYNDGLWPDATHVIFDETEEVNLKATKITQRNEAILLMTKMSDEDKSNMIQILSNKSARGRSTDFINVEIDNLITEQPGQFLKYAQMGREEVYVRAAVLEAIYKNILTKEGTAVFYMGDQIGLDYEAAVAWFRNPQNSKMKVSILEKLNS